MKIKFKSALHRKNFTGFISPKNSDYYCSRSEFVAAAFLLSADKLLWERSDFVNITLHNFLKKNEFFGSPTKFTKRSGVNFGGDPVA